MSKRTLLGTLNPITEGTALAVFDVSLGRTDRAAVILDPNNISTANWSVFNISSRTTSTFTDSNDGATPTLHYVAQLSGSGLVINHKATYYAEVKGSAAVPYITIGDYSAVGGQVNALTGAITQQVGCTVLVGTQMGDGYWPITVSSTVPIVQSYMVFAPCNAISSSASPAYIGTGAGTMSVRNCQVTQISVSTILDQTKRNIITFLDPNDITTTNWTFGHATRPDFQTVHEDGAASTSHWVGPAANFIQNLNVPVYCSFYCKPINRQWVMLSDQGGSSQQYFNMSGSGSVGTSVSATNASCVLQTSGTYNTYYLCTVTLTPTTNTNLGWYIATANNAFTFTGLNQDSFLLTGINIYQPVALYQSVIANQPALVFDTNGLPVLYSDGINDAISGSFTGLSQPITVVIIGKWAAAYSAQDAFFDSTTVNTMHFSRVSSTSVRGYAGSAVDVSATTPTSNHVWGINYNGVSSSIYEDGVSLGSGNIGASNSTGLTLFSTAVGTAFANTYTYYIAIFSGAKDATWFARFQKYAHKRGWV
jgi:hypothetical protein